MMRQQHLAAAMLGGAVGEKRMPCMTRGGFHRLAGFFHPLADVAAADLTGQFEFFRQRFDKARIATGGPAAQLMVEVADDQIMKSRINQQVKHRDRIRAAGNTDQITRAPRSVGEPGNPLGNIHTARNSRNWRERWWLEPGSNQRHADFQSAALPTELSSHTLPCGRAEI